MRRSISRRLSGFARHRFAPLLLVSLLATLAAAAPASSQGPFALLHSVSDPITNAQPVAGHGYSVALDGNIAVSGAPYDDAGAQNSGLVSVYNAATGALLHTLTNPSPVMDDFFGCSVAVSGMRVVVGAYGDNAGAFNAGIAYVYDLASLTPTVPVVTLTNPSPSDLDDSFGYSVAVSGTRVVVGACRDDIGVTDAGSVYVYDLASSTPTVPVATLNHPRPEVGDFFGNSVAVDATRVVAGAPFVDGITVNRGAAYIFGIVPALRIVPAAPGFATISWTPADSASFVLQYSDSLAPSNWLDAPSGEANPVTLPTTNATRFYRLFLP